MEALLCADRLGIGRSLLIYVLDCSSLILHELRKQVTILAGPERKSLHRVLGGAC